MSNKNWQKSASVIRRARFDDVNCVMYVNGTAQFPVTELSSDKNEELLGNSRHDYNQPNIDHTNETAIRRLRKENHNLKKTLSRRWSSRSRSSMVSHMLTTDDEEQDDADDSLYLLRETSTLHGLRDVLLSSSGRLRSIWVIIVILAIVLTLHGCYQIILEFSNERIVVSYFIKEAPGLELPDIVVCPYNRFNSTFLREHGFDFKLAQYIEASYPSNLPTIGSLKERWHEDILADVDQLDAQLEFVLEQLGNISYVEFLHKASLRCEAFFDEHLCENISVVLTSAGACYRVQMDNQKVAGYGNGGSLVITLPEDEYNPGLNNFPNEGVIIKLAEKNKGIDNDLTFVPSGVHAIMPLQGTEYDFMNSPPKYECNEDLYSNYSRVWCFETCLIEEYEDICKCSPAPSQQPKYPKNICTAKQLYGCFLKEHNGTTWNVEKCTKKCRAPCKSWTYGQKLSYSPFTRKKNWGELFGNEEEFKRLQRTIILDVYYSTLDFTCIKHVVAMPLQSLIAQIGGQFSLWAGGSLISLCQIVIYLTRFFLSKCEGRKAHNPKNKKKSTSSNNGTNETTNPKRNGKLMNVEVVRRGGGQPVTTTKQNDRHQDKQLPPL
ncbi:unnamed protein product [Caenorhabditis angaria]|uniref:Uncharacterized protein n=1 Tax=Caenorhabditis angaria TaxID=860376 RepID=A0A9P1NBN4_9PELO|nr:unnamed protein product [Caenorhabditis angaria]